MERHKPVRRCLHSVCNFGHAPAGWVRRGWVRYRRRPNAKKPSPAEAKEGESK